MTSKLFRTTSAIAMTALSVTALCAIAPAVRAEPGNPLRIAQNADGGEGNAAGAENPNPDGKKGEDRRRDGNRQDRGERGKDRRGDGGDAEGGGRPNKTFNRPDTVKSNTPKIINQPNAAESREPPPPAAKPNIRPDVMPSARPVAPPVNKPVIKETTTKAPVMPVGQPNRADDRRLSPIDRSENAGGNTAFGAKKRQELREQEEFRRQEELRQQPQRQREVARPVPKPPVRNLNDAKLGRVESREQGGNRLIIKEADRRTIVKQGDRMVIQKDESAQLRRLSPNAVVTRDRRGRDRTVVRRGNAEVITETDRDGQLLRRYRRDRDGRETVIIDNRRRSKDKFGRNVAIGVGVGAGIIAGAAILNSVVDVPPPRVRVPRDKYIVDYERASDEDVYEALSAPPVDDIEHGYTLDQVRATPYLRERMRRVDLDDITFDTGSWDINPGQYRKLERIARAMQRVIDRNPNEVFLIEGYTDAVGSEVDNLTLSDRRAEAVSVVLTEEFGVPFENLTTQGYGEQYLKIPTDGPERANRRVAARRITPLLNRDISSATPPPGPGYDDRDEYDEPPRERRWRRYN